MFGGFGSIQGMIVSLRNNRELLKRQRYFQFDKDKYQKLRHDYRAQLKNTVSGQASLSPEQRAQIRKKIKDRYRARQIRSISLTGFILIAMVLSGFIYYNKAKAERLESRRLKEQTSTWEETKAFNAQRQIGDIHWRRQEYQEAGNAYFDALLIRRDLEVEKLAVKSLLKACEKNPLNCKRNQRDIELIISNSADSQELESLRLQP